MACAGCARRRAKLKRFFFGDKPHCDCDSELRGHEWLAIESMDLEAGLAHVRLFGKSHAAALMTLQLPTECLSDRDLKEHLVGMIHPNIWQRAEYCWHENEAWRAQSERLKTVDPQSTGGAIYEGPLDTPEKKAV